MSLAAKEILTVHDLVLSHGFEPLLDGASFSVGPGEKVGLVGRNGCGKTSLLKILTGADAPDGGTIARPKDLRVGYLPQEFELQDDRTVLENVQSGAADVMEWLRRYESGEGDDEEHGELLELIEHADGWNLDNRIRVAGEALGLPALDARVGPLSGGEKRRVALVRAIIGQPDLLLLDEPTNHLDADSIGWLEAFLNSFKGAVVFVTHDRYFLDIIATRVLELDQGKIYSHDGNYTAYLESKAIRQQIAGQTERRRQRFLRVELDWVKSGVRARRTKSTHRLDKFYEIKELAAPPEEREMDLLIPPAPDLGNRGFELHNAGAKVGEGENERWLFRHLDLSLQRGTCTGIVGRNGVGKTTLLQACIGTREPDEGEVKIGAKVELNYIDQSRMALNPQATLISEVSGEDETVIWGNGRLSTRAYLKRFLFNDDRIGQKVERLSGGERARLTLAKVLRHGGNVLVLDEPTNDLDLPSLRILEGALSDFPGIVLVVSHDRYFLDRVCDQIVAFEPGGVFVQPGNYSYYLEKRREREQAKAARAEFKAADIKKKPAPKAASRRLSFKEQRELEGMEELILGMEEQVAELEATLSDPEFYVTRAGEAGGLTVEMEVLKKKIAGLYERWQELESIASGS
jgi:ATP-binding cassette subfamily F protein uup